MQRAVLKTSKLSKTFSNGGMQQHILKNLDLEIYNGDFTVIMGSSGAGKSTLLYALSGMDKPTLGEIYFGNQEITGLSNDKLAIFRRKNCGFVFQQIYLLDNMSVMDNIIACGLLLSGNKKEIAERARKLLSAVGLNENVWHKFPSQLSGGEAQRCGIVRALINNPGILFADEPTGALNSSSGIAVLNVLTEVNEKGQSIIMVTHDLKSALRGSRIIYLKDGSVCGECNLGTYRGEDENRNTALLSFLKEMGW
ncbi:ABC transporter ATP-binding protein [Clostridium sp. KNHs205]|jgi:putative ABC transport system ATP-binding protein|uniref:ABC transporter ATP-binding protein n=1 Tax=Clostridium sp. KNHs205 TaxID=1449050 RepID=UPI00051B27B9|nr:ABC transporter ATP-binding protein [Clostridium sp. KNHs205]